MKKINIIKSNEEYNRIIQNNKPFIYKEYMIFLERNNNLNKYSFGFSISKKFCKAFMRNKIKRQLKNILDQKDYQNNFNCIIMVRKSILDKTYQEKEKVLLEALEKLNIFKKEKQDEK